MMNFDPDDRLDGYGSSLGICGPYEPSIASSASSSQVSVFSDTLSAQSSIASSISDDFRCTQSEDARERDTICAQAQLRYQAQVGGVEERSVLDNILKPSVPCPTYADVTSVPAPQRQHPRRCSVSKGQKPPPLVRQRDRKINFVDNLVDSATQMVEVIWPLSSIFCPGEAGERGVLPLRKYIEETLKRSRTSYSTLQVALYYLILIRPHIPKSDFTMEQTMDCPAGRALMCGRRMFLAALILASKYLQDRNYSAKAWSKMSGLKVCEINQNERSFLSKIDWNLHLPKPLFEKWQDIVLRYTPNPPAALSTMVMESGCSTWKRMIPLLTPELDNLPVIEEKLSSAFKLPACSGFTSPPTPAPATPTPTKSMFNLAPIESTSMENTPTPSTILPRYLEPTPELGPPTPALAGMGPLPTPNMTPSSIASNTPAVSVFGSQRPSMCSAMAFADQMNSNRCLMDSHPVSDSRYSLSRRPSMMSVTSYGSSPESMVSDRSSRSSSISSVSTNSSMAPQRACLARQATCRNARLPPLKLLREETNVGTATKPIIIDEDMDVVSSPEITDFSVSEKVLHTPHRHSRSAKHAAPTTTSAPNHHHLEKSCKKRGRPVSSGHRRSELQEEVRYLLEESLDDERMELDDDNLVVSPSYAADYASEMLVRGASTREAQPTSLTRRESGRVAVAKNEGKKRTCCSAEAMSISPAPLYGEIV